MLQKAISGTMSKAHLNGFNKMVNHKLDYFYLQGKVSLSLAFIHGIATTWYLFSADKKAFVNNNGVSDSKRGVIRSVKSILTSRCPVDCSLNAGILSTAGFLLEQKMGSLFMIKCVSLLFVSTIVAINVKSLIKSTQNIITDNQNLNNKPSIIGMHPLSLGIGLIYAMKMVSNPTIGMILFGGTFATDLVLWRGLDCFGYLPALFMGLLF